LNIQLNDQPLDVTIGETETLGEVVRDLEAWLRGSDLVLYSVRHQDRELLSRPEEEWAAIPQGQITTLQVTVKPARDLTILNLQTVLEYLDLLAANLDGENPSPAVVSRELLDGYPAMAQSFGQHFPDSRPALQRLEDLLRTGQLPDPAGSQAPALIESLRTRVALRLGELTDPQEALRVLERCLDRCIAEISEVSILLQTGRNRQAMEVMIRFSELSQDLVRVVGRDLNDCEVDGKSLPEFYKELNGILSELIEAFGARDSVLIGDLMEYEVAPRLRSLRSFLHEHGARS
jgi:hypothetical protein